MLKTAAFAESMNVSEKMQGNTYPLLSIDIINAFLDARKKSGCHEKTYRQDQSSVLSLYQFLAEDKRITPEKLESFRTELKQRGYAKTTVSSYIKGINHLLDFMDAPELKYKKGCSYDLTGKQYGSLTVVSKTGKKYCRNHIWLCRCACGNEVEVPSASLTSGNTTSCGCLKGDFLRSINRFIDHTSLRQSLADDPPRSERAASGYTGVMARGDKWRANIRYKGKTYYLGTYRNVEDAVKARIWAKELVKKDALKLEKLYLLLHTDEEIPHQPPKPAPYIRQNDVNRKDVGNENNIKNGNQTSVIRRDNTSGCTGVSKKRDKWSTSITLEGKRYFLGCYKELDEAVRVRKQAEQYIESYDFKALEAMCREKKDKTK